MYPPDCVNWAGLTHAYGSAADIPDHLLALTSMDSVVRREAYQALEGAVCHQGSRYEASAYVARFLVQLLTEARVPDRPVVLRLLATLAIGYDRWWLPRTYPVDAVRREIERHARLTVPELKAELAHWAEAAPTDRLRRSRRLDAKFQDVEENRDNQRWGLEAYDAVRGGVPVYGDILTAGDRDVRLWAAYLLSWFPEEQAVSLPALIPRLDAEADSSVVATLAIAIGLLAPVGDPSAWSALHRHLRSPEHVVRWAAAIGLSRLDPSVNVNAVEELYACVRHAPSLLTHRVPYLEGDLGGLGALMLAELGDTAPDRLKVLVERLADWPAGRPADSLVKSLLKIAFPDGPADKVRFADLTEDQRAVVMGLTSWPAIWTYANVSLLMAEYGLPNSYGELQYWTRDTAPP